jgi:hypothetical protein
VKLKALLLCEDIRLEIGGTVTLVGVFNERLIAPPGEGAIEIPRLAFLGVIGGLRGVERIGFRQWIRFDDAEEPPGELQFELHEPNNDEHNFVFTDTPVVFPDVGTYELALDITVGDRTQSYRYPFSVERSG